ncbi:MAG TPA: acyl-CoA dehydrogenase family protein [Labilithrix sp.]|nr:acyl-CoA dehydrogenase family protein [Labilithrix sp.]
MDFAIDDARRIQTRAFGAAAIAPSLAERDRERRWDPTLFRRMGRAGLLSLGLPLASNSDKPATPSTVELGEALVGFAEGSGDAGLSLAWAARTSGCAAPIARFGSVEQQERYLPALVDGQRIGALAHEEADPSGDPTDVQTVATRLGPKRWVLDGTKTWVVNGPIADVFVVTAVTSSSARERGISAFVIDGETRGWRLGRPIEPIGMRTAAISELILEGCEVTDRDLLGPEGGAFTHALRLIRRWQRGLLLSPWVGLMRALLDRSFEHARTRRSLGAPLAIRSPRAPHSALDACRKYVLQLTRRTT